MKLARRRLITEYSARTALGLAATYEGVMAVDRFEDRKYTFLRARERAQSMNKRLIVVGDPDGGAHTRMLRAYGCGDVTIDITGAPTCPNGIRADITDRIPLDNDAGIVFVSCVFEYVSDPVKAYAECLRVAGRRENLFVTRVSPATLTSLWYPGAKWTMRYRANGDVYFEPVSTTSKLVAAGIVAATAYAAWRGI